MRRCRVRHCPRSCGNGSWNHKRMCLHGQGCAVVRVMEGRNGCGAQTQLPTESAQGGQKAFPRTGPRSGLYFGWTEEHEGSRSMGVTGAVGGVEVGSGRGRKV